MHVHLFSLAAKGNLGGPEGAANWPAWPPPAAGVGEGGDWPWRGWYIVAQAAHIIPKSQVSPYCPSVQNLSVISLA